MKLFPKLIISAFIFLSSALAPVSIFASAKSDYEYQYSQYRQNYIEYTILKKDFLENPTLDNQQKAVLAAKQTIASRDLAKAGFAAYLIELCNEKQTKYSPVKPILDSLASAKSYFLSSAANSQSIVTPANLNTFSTDYAINTVPHDRSFRTGVIACKISELVRFQIESKNALDVILPKLSTPFSTPLQNRIDDLQTQGNKINDTINTLTDKFFTEEDAQNIDGENYFTDKSETIKKIKLLQIKWIDSLIDIDLNYAHS
jgi:hypothetical protein